MPSVLYNGTKIAESDSTVVIEGNHYFPPESVNMDLLKSSPTTYHCPWKGDCEYYSGNIDGKVQKDIAWYYPNPFTKAASIKGYLAFDKSQVKIA